MAPVRSQASDKQNEKKCFWHVLSSRHDCAAISIVASYIDVVSAD